MMIYSPDVPVFRNDDGRLLDRPYKISFITSAAPNRGAMSIRSPAQAREVDSALATRAAYVLALALHKGHRRLVLGAWGCGVFRNEPRAVAEAFRALLGPGGAFRGRLERVVFAVFDPSRTQDNLRAFLRTFDGAAAAAAAVGHAAGAAAADVPARVGPRVRAGAEGRRGAGNRRGRNRTRAGAVEQAVESDDGGLGVADSQSPAARLPIRRHG